MPVDRSLFTREFPVGKPNLGLLCPTCRAGHFRLEDRPIAKQTRQSRDAMEYVFPEEGWEAHFATVLVCDNSDCQDTSIFAGKQSVRIDRTCQCPDCEFREGHYYEVLLPSVFSPAPLLIAIPKGTSDDVAMLVHKACSEAWGDPAAALNSLRMALELLCAEFGVEAKKPGGAFRPLADRLQDLGTLLDQPTKLRAAALRWLGNSGSHVGEVTQEHALDGLDIFELVLDSLQDASRSQTDRKVAAIVAAKAAPTAAELKS